MDMGYQGLTAPCPECDDEDGFCEHSYGARPFRDNGCDMDCIHCGTPIPGDHKPPYCSLECLCLYNAARVRAERLANVRLPYKEA